MQSDLTIIQEYYQHHVSWLYQWLYKKMGSTHDAADISQDTFIKLLQKGGLAEIQEPRAYLVTVAHGLMVSHYRRKIVEKAYIDALILLGESLEFSPEDHAISLETLYELDLMLSQLSNNVKEAYLMLHLEELSYSEIAKKLGVSTRTITTYIAKATLHCALFKLQK